MHLILSNSARDHVTGTTPAWPRDHAVRSAAHKVLLADRDLTTVEPTWQATAMCPLMAMHPHLSQSLILCLRLPSWLSPTARYTRSRARPSVASAISVVRLSQHRPTSYLNARAKLSELGGLALTMCNYSRLSLTLVSHFDHSSVVCLHFPYSGVPRPNFFSRWWLPGCCQVLPGEPSKFASRPKNYQVWPG